MSRKRLKIKRKFKVTIEYEVEGNGFIVHTGRPANRANVAALVGALVHDAAEVGARYLTIANDDGSRSVVNVEVEEEKL